jgi:hypothetical protein
MIPSGASAPARTVPAASRRVAEGEVRFEPGLRGGRNRQVSLDFPQHSLLGT